MICLEFCRQRAVCTSQLCKQQCVRQLYREDFMWDICVQRDSEASKLHVDNYRGLVFSVIVKKKSLCVSGKCLLLDFGGCMHLMSSWTWKRWAHRCEEEKSARKLSRQKCNQACQARLWCKCKKSIAKVIYISALREIENKIFSRSF